MQQQHSSQATSTLGNTPNLNIGFLHQKENPILLVNAPNCHLSLVLASVVQGDAVNGNTLTF